jgi:HAD domain in Swiss Army Knife RNA repair proteins
MNDSKLQRIIFIDIDGPIINTPCYFLDGQCSMERTVMNTQALGYIADLVKSSGAKIVTNSTHNTHDVVDLLTGQNRTLKHDLVKWGLDTVWFHDNWHTSYPFAKGAKFSEYTSHQRLKAIEQWQEENGESDWICFDDEPFTEDPRLIVIDFDLGIDEQVWRTARDFWGLKTQNIIV